MRGKATTLSEQNFKATKCFIRYGNGISFFAFDADKKNWKKN